MTAMGTLLADIQLVFAWILGKCVLVLREFTNPDNLVLIILLALMVVGAVFSFGMRLIHRR